VKSFGLFVAAARYSSSASGRRPLSQKSSPRRRCAFQFEGSSWFASRSAATAASSWPEARSDSACASFSSKSCAESGGGEGACVGGLLQVAVAHVGRAEIDGEGGDADEEDGQQGHEDRGRTAFITPEVSHWYSHWNSA
jgi:hypothetical protein